MQRATIEQVILFGLDRDVDVLIAVEGVFQLPLGRLAIGNVLDHDDHTPPIGLMARQQRGPDGREDRVAGQRTLFGLGLEEALSLVLPGFGLGYRLEDEGRPVIKFYRAQAS